MGGKCAVGPWREVCEVWLLKAFWSCYSRCSYSKGSWHSMGLWPMFPSKHGSFMEMWEKTYYLEKSMITKGNINFESMRPFSIWFLLLQMPMPLVMIANSFNEFWLNTHQSQVSVGFSLPNPRVQERCLLQTCDHTLRNGWNRHFVPSTQ